MRIAVRKPHLAVVGCGFIASALVYSKTFGPYITWEGERLSHEIESLFLLPIAAAVIYLLIGSLRSRGPSQADSHADKALDHIVLCVLLFLTGVHALLLSVLLQIQAVRPWASRGVVVLVGLTLIAVGNLLPRTRPNIALGIRTSRTLADRQLWMLTHRATGYVAVAVGVVTALAGVLASGRNVAGWSGIAFLVGAIVLAACYWWFARSRAKDLAI